jgi:hypothetical protein
MPALSSAITAFYADRAGGGKYPLDVSRPSADISTSYSQFYVTGTSDPSEPLYLNGNPVENRSASGFFGILVPLAKGENVLDFSQQGESVRRVIKRGETSETSQLPVASIVKDSAFPTVPEYRQGGETKTFKMQGSGGREGHRDAERKAYAMKTASSSGGLYPATFTCAYTVPVFTKGSPRNVSLGIPLYTMKYNGLFSAGMPIRGLYSVMNGSPFYAEVKSDVIDTYETPSSSNGAYHEIYKGNAGLHHRHDRGLCPAVCRRMGQEKRREYLYVR